MSPLFTPWVDRGPSTYFQERLRVLVDRVQRWNKCQISEIKGTFKGPAVCQLLQQLSVLWRHQAPFTTTTTTTIYMYDEEVTQQLYNRIYTRTHKHTHTTLYKNNNNNIMMKRRLADSSNNYTTGITVLHAFTTTRMRREVTSNNTSPTRPYRDKTSHTHTHISTIWMRSQ